MAKNLIKISGTNKQRNIYHNKENEALIQKLT